MKINNKSKKNKSPCIDVCDFSGQNGWCRGCGRTWDECQDWHKMKPYSRQKLEKELKRRLAKLEKKT